MSDTDNDHPLPGTFAFTARLLAEMGIMSGDEADEWKDAMKDAEMEEWLAGDWE